MFKPINGLEGKYSVSDDGRVFSHTRKDTVGRPINGRELKATLDKDGYKRVALSLGSRASQKVYIVSRLVAEVFIDNPDNKPVVNHLDGDKLNNNISNLEWATHKENTIHAWKSGLCKTYDRSLPYNREGIVASNKQRRKWFSTHKEYCKKYYEEHKKEKQCGI